jgi:hypothetical protein
MAQAAAWPQWGQNPQHSGFLSVGGQALQTKLSDQIFDPFTAQEEAESGGSLLGPSGERFKCLHGV